SVLVPPNPGNVSAFGLLTVDVKNDYVQTYVTLQDNLDTRAVGAIYDDLTAQATVALDKEGFTRDRHQFVRTADLRYFGQAFEVRVPVPDGPVDQALVERVAQAFHDAHRALYGYDFAGDVAQQVEWVNLRVTGIGPIQRPEIRRHGAAPAGEQPVPASRRPVCFDAADGYADAGVYWRPDLRPGHELHGPAIVEEYGSTVPIHPGFGGRVDEYLNIIVTREGTAR
ncbi:MAG: hydantoinase/oxoprolinase family protein, partial [Nocardioidaceae bacterium]